jgi:histidine triad (HIT) family protein
MADCIFCRIAKKEVPSDILLETEDLVAFRDINPQAPTHIVLIPRRHIAKLLDLEAGDDALIGKLLRAANDLARKQGIAERGFRLVANCNREAGQSVDHLHFHLLGGRPMRWPPG